jgi:hypothetical protein
MKIKDKIKFLEQNINQLLVIHYSCQNLNDNNEGYSPRITSIAVLHLGSSTMHSFSIHLIAEVKKIKREEIQSHYDELEAQILHDFYSFIKGHQDHYWLHWNMSNINYGFEAIEHRFRVLTNKEPAKVDDSKKYNLSALISGIYGNHYVDDPKMLSLMDINGGKHRDFLTGKEEVEVFQRQEYMKLHKSTMCKVYFFQSIFHKLTHRKVKTKYSNLPSKLNSITESLTAKILSLIAVLFTIYQLGLYGYQSYGTTQERSNQKSQNLIIPSNSK